MPDWHFLLVVKMSPRVGKENKTAASGIVRDLNWVELEKNIDRMGIWGHYLI